MSSLLQIIEQRVKQQKMSLNYDNTDFLMIQEYFETFGGETFGDTPQKS